jgi:hypothetical protein
MFLGIAASAMAAEVSLQDDGRLTGEVSSMDADGTIELESLLSKKPLCIRADKTIRIDFGSDKRDVHVSGQKLQLRNGDVLPVRVNSMADGLLEAESDDLGSLSIPREMISTIQLGIFPQRLIYSGPEDFKGWKRDKANPDSWKINDSEFVAKGNGTISRDAELPEKFILKFSFIWKNYPFLKVGFAEPQDAESGSVDRYLFQLVGSSLGVMRESNANKGNVPIVSMNRTSGRLQDSRMDVEIRVDRTRGQLQLYIDGEMEGRYIDPLAGIPSGTGISISTRSASGGVQKIGNIKVFEWDDRADRHRTEDRGDGKSDSLIGRNGERLGGRLTGIRSDGDESVYLFKSDFQKGILELPEQEVSTVFVSASDDFQENYASEGFILSLRGGGQLTVSSCVFGSEKVTAKHPLLGDVQIDRAGVTSLVRRVVPKAKPVKRR